MIIFLGLLLFTTILLVVLHQLLCSLSAVRYDTIGEINVDSKAEYTA